MSALAGPSCNDPGVEGSLSRRPWTLGELVLKKAE